MQSVKRTDTFSLNGLRALVTGASSGLGRHFAHVLAAAGAEIIAGARRRELLDALVTGIAKEGGRATAVTLDVTSRQSVRAALEETGPIDILVNNAGVTFTQALVDCTDGDWRAVLDTNLTGAWTVAQETAKSMIQAGCLAGSIINVTSILATRVAVGVSSYIAAKAGLRALTQSMALELARYGIRVNSLAPGYIVTDLNRDFLLSDRGSQLQKRIPARRFGEYADLDGPLLLLASSAGKYMSGAEIVVDGGHLCSTL